VTTGIDDRILKKLETLGKTGGPLPGALEFYGKLLSAQSAARLRIGTPRPGLSPEEIKARITAERRLLEFEDLSVDWSLFRDTLKEVSALLSGYSKAWGEIAAGVKIDALPLEKLAKASFEGTRLPVPGDSAAAKAFWEFVVQAAFRPFLTGHAEALLGSIDTELWRRGYCPVCGGSPDLAFLDKERGARWLLCSRCDAKWLFQRLECPYCGTQDQNALAYFPDDKGLYRLYVCERCRHYLKAVDLRQTGDDVLLALERFLTLDLDIQAQKNGYKPLMQSNGATGLMEDS